MIRSAFGKVSLALAATALIAGPVLAQSTNTLQTPPIKMGTSGGSANDASKSFCCAGTLGALILYNGVPHILSNNHVLARSGSAAVGEDVVQPGLIDSACRTTGSNVVADFAGDKTPLGTNVDVGIAAVRTGMVDPTGAILNVGVPCSSTQTPTVGLSVRKSGRTTGHTTGTIQAVNVSTSIQYQSGCNSGKKFTASYTNQISITPGTFSAGGDSGSLILSNDGTPNPVGLLFAGSSAVTIANPIQSVVSALQAGGNTVSFVGTACSGTGASTADSIIAGISESEVQYVKGIKERHEASLFARPGVVGVGVGKVNDNSDTNEAAIIVYVESNKSALPKGFPKQLDGIKVRLIPTDPIVARCGA
jgi:hypothetical protein